MKYENVCDALMREFPELEPANELLHAEGDENKPGAYIVFEDIFRSYVLRILASAFSENRNAKLYQIFSFLEKLLADGGKIENLAFISLLEGQSGPWLQAAKPFLGPLAESALDEYDHEWRTKSVLAGHQLNYDGDIDLYGVTDIALNVLY